jgi:hypothetical protein
MPPRSPSFSPSGNKELALPKALRRMRDLPKSDAATIKPSANPIARMGWLLPKWLIERKKREILPVVDLAGMLDGFDVILLRVSRIDVLLGRIASPEMVMSQ